MGVATPKTHQAARKNKFVAAKGEKTSAVVLNATIEVGGPNQGHGVCVGLNKESQKTKERLVSLLTFAMGSLGALACIITFILRHQVNIHAGGRGPEHTIETIEIFESTPPTRNRKTWDLRLIAECTRA